MDLEWMVVKNKDNSTMDIYKVANFKLKILPLDLIFYLREHDSNPIICFSSANDFHFQKNISHIKRILNEKWFLKMKPCGYMLPF